MPVNKILQKTGQHNPFIYAAIVTIHKNSYCNCTAGNQTDLYQLLKDC